MRKLKQDVEVTRNDDGDIFFNFNGIRNVVFTGSSLFFGDYFFENAPLNIKDIPPGAKFKCGEKSLVFIKGRIHSWCIEYNYAMTNTEIDLFEGETLEIVE